MLAILMTALIAAVPPVVAGSGDETARLPQAVVVQAGDPGQQINRGIVLARHGDETAARQLFLAARDNGQWLDLKIPSGNWVNSRTLARRALAMLKQGKFAASEQMAMR